MQDPALADRIGGSAAVAQGLVEAAEGFATTYWLATVLVALTLVPAFFLPRRREVSHLTDDDAAPAMVLH